jgi:hypothetical protein
MSVDAGQGSSRQVSIRLILVLLIVWGALALVAELSFGSFLFEISGDEISGVLAARGGFSGAAVVPLTLYVYAFIRGPVRYRGLLWIGVLEQGVAAFAAGYHVLLGHISPEGGIVSFLVSIALMVLLLTNMPRRSEA